MLSTPSPFHQKPVPPTSRAQTHAECQSAEIQAQNAKLDKTQFLHAWGSEGDILVLSRLHNFYGGRLL